MSDQQTPEIEYENKTLSADVEGLYLNVITSDVNFTVKSNDDEDEIVPAHKNLLSARSDVFHAMFYGTLREKGDVRIVDATPAAFKEFLKFFYHSKVELNMENVSGVMNLGNKYNVAACLDACVELLKKKGKITVENACNIYGLAIIYEQDDIKQLCQEKIIANTEAVFASSSFLECSKPLLRHILDFDTVSCSEGDVFKACMAWVKSRTGEETVTKDMIEQHLGELFFQIRFRSMTFQEFSELIPTFEDLFSFDEHKECVQLIGSKDFQPRMFTSKIRQRYAWRYENIYAGIECNRDSEYVTTYCRSSGIGTIFSTNESIMLTELVFESLRIYRDEIFRDDLIENLDTEITITKISNFGDEKELSKEKSRLHCGSSTVVTLTKPILARPENKYRIKLKHSSNEHCYKMAKLKTKVELDPNIIIQFHYESTSAITGTPMSPIIALRFARIAE